MIPTHASTVTKTTRYAAATYCHSDGMPFT
jgi:predicted CxxxxCH...CXXCH cytochrome family protein